ncbi:MAG: gamma-glutamylcyclotransferase family protein [Arenicellales bacterium]
MSGRRVDVFFYGSYINFDVLNEAGIYERPFQAARLPGYRLEIAPLANLVPDDGSQAFGILTRLTHLELDRLYLGHAREKLGGTYLPEAVLVSNIENRLMPALCYISHDMEWSDADPAYVNRIARPAREYGFPADYVEYIESFKQEAFAL